MPHPSIVLASLALSLLAGSSVAVRAADAPTANELVAKNAAARGGADKLAALASIRFRGKMIAPGDYELAYTETRVRRRGQARYESTIQGLTLLQGYDGKTAWRIDPFQGRRDAERMSDDDTRALADDATIDGPLLGAKSHGSTVTYLGREDFEGTDTYKLRVAQPGGAEYLYYLDPDTYLEIKVVETRTLRGAQQVTQLEYSDYEAVDGVYFPFAVESGPPDSTPSQRQRLIIEGAQANVPVSDAQFAMPGAARSK